MDEIDLTASLPDYKVSDFRRVVYKTNQTIYLDSPAFVHTINMNKVESFGNSPLAQGTDWTILDSDIDQDAMARGYGYSESFTGTLAKSITMLTTAPPRFNIAIDYQKLEKNIIPHDIDTLNNITLTPDLIKEILRQLQAVKSTHSSMTNVTATTLAKMKTLPEDLTGESATNYIADERHSVDVPNNRQIIRPAQGSFYDNNLKVIAITAGTPLVKDTDFVLGGLNVERTTAANTSSGVYDYILVKTSIVGDVDISYQAYGGEVTASDMGVMKSALYDITGYLSNTNVLTNENLGNNLIIQQIANEQTAQGETLRSLLTGTPNYAAKTFGKCFIHKLATTDTSFHYWTIASLYTVEGSPDVVTADRLHYRIKCVELDQMFDVVITANIGDLENPFSVECLSELSNKGYKPFDHYNNLINRVVPKFRIIWNEVGNVRSGIHLQIGMALKSISVATIAVEDLSGNESCWLMRSQAPANTNINAEDNTILLPNGSSTWSTAVNTSLQAVKTLPIKDGYLGWAGSLAMNSLTTMTKLVSIFDERDVTIEHVSKVVFNIYDRKTGKHFNTTSDVIAGSNVIEENVLFFADDLCTLSYKINYDLNSKIEFSLQAIQHQSSIDNARFDLNHITVFFD